MPIIGRKIQIIIILIIALIVVVIITLQLLSFNSYGFLRYKTALALGVINRHGTSFYNIQYRELSSLSHTSNGFYYLTTKETESSNNTKDLIGLPLKKYIMDKNESVVGNENSNLPRFQALFYPSESPNIEVGGGPLIIYFHGGGWISGRADQFDNLCDAISQSYPQEGGISVLNIDYPLIQEIQNFDQLLQFLHEEVLSWCYQYGCQFLNINPNHIILCGEDAGGHLVSSLCLYNRDQATYPIPIYSQILLYPLLNTRTTNKTSFTRFKEQYGLCKNHVMFSIESLHKFNIVVKSNDDTNLTGAASSSRYISPYHEIDLCNLPPLLLVLPQYDITRLDSVDFADRMDKCGNNVQVRIVSGTIHGFLSLDFLDETPETLNFLGQYISSKINSNNTPKQLISNQGLDNPGWLRTLDGLRKLNLSLP